MSLVAQLARVRSLFAAGVEQGSAEDLEASVEELVSQLATATPRQRQEAKQPILSLVEALVAFGQQFIEQHSAQPEALSKAALNQASVAWRALLACCNLCRHVALQPADSLRLLSAASLLFGAGPLVLRSMGAREAREPSAWQRYILGQARMALHLFFLLSEVGLGCDASGNLAAAFARTAARPAVMLPWVAALASALQQVTGGPGVDEDLLYGTLSNWLQLIQLVLGATAWKRHGDELLARPADLQALLGCLLRRLLPVLAARMEAAAARGIGWESVQPLGPASVQTANLWQGQEPAIARSGARLPPGGSDPYLGGLLGSADTRLFYELHLASGYAGILSDKQLEWQQAAAVIPSLERMAAALPQSRPAAMPAHTFCTLHGALASLLAMCCTAVRRAAQCHLAQPPSAGDSAALGRFVDQHLSPAAWAALRLVPYMARTLRAVAADLPTTADRIDGLSACYAAALWVLSPAGSVNSCQVDSWEQVSMWAAAADAGLRVLPVLAECGRPSGRSGPTAGTMHSPAENLASPLLVWLAFLGCMSAPRWCQQAALPPPALRKVLASQLWQLHSSVARLAHLCTSRHGPQCLGPEVLQAWSCLGFELLHHVFVVARTLLCDAGEPASGLCQALCVAHFEALQAAADVNPSSVPRMLHALTMVAHGCPYLMGPQFMAVLLRLLSIQQMEVSDQQSKVLACSLLLSDGGAQDARRRKAAELAASGVLQQACREGELLLQSGEHAGPHLGVVCQNQTVSLLNGAMDTLAALEEWAAEQLEHSSSDSTSEDEAGQLQQLRAALQGLQRAGQQLVEHRLAHLLVRPAEVLQPLLSSAANLAQLLRGHWAQPERVAADRLAEAQAAAARSCAYLRCTNLGGEGGPAAGEGVGSQRCSACRAVWYCGTACSHADWRDGHRRVCKALGAVRLAEKEPRRAA